MDVVHCVNTMYFIHSVHESCTWITTTDIQPFLNVTTKEQPPYSIYGLIHSLGMINCSFLCLFNSSFYCITFHK